MVLGVCGCYNPRVEVGQKPILGLGCSKQVWVIWKSLCRT